MVEITAAESKKSDPLKINGLFINCTQTLLPNINYSQKNSEIFQSVLAIFKEIYACEMKTLMASWMVKYKTCDLLFPHATYCKRCQRT
jgi:hypothetical protein